MENKQNKGGGLNKSLKLIFVYTVATAFKEREISEISC